MRHTPYLIGTLVCTFCSNALAGGHGSSGRKPPGFHHTNDYYRKDGTHVSDYFSGHGMVLSRSSGSRIHIGTADSFTRTDSDSFSNSSNSLFGSTWSNYNPWNDPGSPERQRAMAQAQLDTRKSFDSWNEALGYPDMGENEGDKTARGAVEATPPSSSKGAPVTSGGLVRVPASAIDIPRALPQGPETVVYSQISCQVVGVLDDCSLEVELPDSKANVRFYGIQFFDDPEQWKRSARKQIAALCLRQYVTVFPSEIISPTQFVGTVRVKSVDIALNLIANGFAKVSAEVPLSSKMRGAENSARNGHKGYWRW